MPKDTDAISNCPTPAPGSAKSKKADEAGTAKFAVRTAVSAPEPVVSRLLAAPFWNLRNAFSVELYQISPFAARSDLPPQASG